MAGKVVMGTLNPSSRARLDAMMEDAGEGCSLVLLRAPMVLAYENLDGEVEQLDVPSRTEMSLFVNREGGEFSHLLNHISRRTHITFFISGTYQVSVMSDGVLEWCNPERMRVQYDFRPPRAYAGAL